MHALPSNDERSAELPRPLTRMQGREADLDRLLALIGEPANRLVTIIGPGGVGKTRLAVHLAATLINEFEREVMYVPLAAIRDASLVLPTIARELGVVPAAGESVEDAVTRALEGRRPLLVLDNFEQVLDAAPSIAALLARAPAMTALVTSRAALGIPGEQRFPLAPLSTPAPGASTAGDILRSDAVAVFVARARSVRPDLVIDDRTATTIGEICRRLDGLPLAIELAAARVNLLSPEALLARLSNRLQVLGGDQRGVPARLQTMRNAIAWSYDLLAPHEQELFRKLSVFGGGCSLDAVEAIARQARLPHDCWNTLGALVDHSLVQALSLPSGETRFVMLETLREFGLEQLAIAGEVEEAQLAHAAWFVDLAEAAESEFVGQRQGLWFDRMDIEWDNIRLACDWALTAGRPTLVLRILGALWRFASSRGHTTESRALLDLALTATDGDETPERCHALVAAGNFAQDQRDLENTRPLLEQARDLAVRIGSGTDEVRALIGLAHEAHDRGDYAAATGSNAQAIERATEIGDQRHLASALAAMGNINYFQGNLDAARRFWEEGREIVAVMGDRQAEALLLGNLGAVASSLGEFERAVEYQEQALALGRELNDLPAVGYALINLAEDLRVLGDLPRAEASTVEGVSLLHDLGLRGAEAQGTHILASIVRAQGDSRRAASVLGPAIEQFALAGDQRNLAESVGLFAGICVDLGMPEDAIELMSAADALRQGIGAVPGPVHEKEFALISTRLRQQVRDATYERHWHAGQQLADGALVARLTELAARVGGLASVSREKPVPPGPLDALTGREHEVMRLLVEGQSAREIGDSLFISPRTVTTHINNIYVKLGVSTRAQAVAQAVRAGLE